jgi:serine phosphatase RsbU (regulator of sigma subunit)/PAS domain-containing protein
VTHAVLAGLLPGLLAPEQAAPFLRALALYCRAVPGSGPSFSGGGAAITALDHLQHFVGLLTVDGVVLEANASALRAGGLTRDQVVGRPLWETGWWAHSAHTQEELRQAVERAARGEAVRYLAEVLAGDEGRTLITIEFRLSPVGGAADSPVRYLVPEGHPVLAAAEELGGSGLAWASMVAELVDARQQTDRLRRLATGLAEARTIAEVAAAIADRAGDALGATFANVALSVAGEKEIDLYHPPSLGHIATRWRRVKVDRTTVLGEAIISGRAVHVPDLAELTTRYPSMRADAEAAGLQALAGYPLETHDTRMRAAIGLGWNHRHQTHTDEIDPVLALCAAALQRAWTGDELARSEGERKRRDQQQRRLSRELQAGLLPTQIPTVSGWDVAVRYSASPTGLDIGGDWYDVMEIDVDDYAVVVGDTVGHDVRAATGMSQLRNALAGLSHARRDPAAVLDRLDDYATHTSGLLGATVFYARLQPSTGIVHHTSAGHPPPLVLRRDGSVAFLTDGRATPIGVRAGRRTGTCRLEVGDVLLGYTDGLIERRDEPITDGMARLMRFVAEAGPKLPLEELTDRLLSRLRPSQAIDDIALVAVRRQR